jgi:hypothetical protein
MKQSGLQALVRAAAGQAGVRRLVDLYQTIPARDREEALQVIAAEAARSDPHGRLIRLLAAASEPAARSLALALVARVAAPDRSFVPILQPLLADRRLPFDDQLAAIAVLFQAIGKSGPAAVELIRSFIVGLDHDQASERLAALRQRFGKVPALQEVRAQLGTAIDDRCPTCNQPMDRPQLRKHLWEAHRLVLDGSLARPPWAVIEDWLASAASNSNPDLLSRCFELALHADPENGLARIDRMLAAHGIDVPVAAGSPPLVETSTTCPRCSHRMRIAETHSTPALNAFPGRLSAAGYRVEIQESGPIPQLFIETPQGIVWQGREPGRLLTHRARVLLASGVPLLAVVLLALLFPDHQLAIRLCVLGSLLGFGLVHLVRHIEPTSLDRGIDHAWTVLAPRLHADGFSIADSGFLAGLAEVSGGHGRPRLRDRVLESILALTERASLVDPRVVGHLAALRRLTIDDAGSLGRDPEVLLVRQLIRCLGGQLPFRLVDLLLGSWTDSIDRLRILLCGRAFEAGLEPADLIETARLSGALGRLLGTEPSATLTRLHRLWSLQATRPWDRCGDARTVFQLVEQDPALATRLLQRWPDLLLYQHISHGQRSDAGPEEVAICGRGVVAGDRLVTVPPPVQDIHSPILARWFQFYFHDWAGLAPDSQLGPGTGIVDRLRLPDAQVCPECGTRFLGRPGEPGIAIS